MPLHRIALTEGQSARLTSYDTLIQRAIERRTAFVDAIVLGALTDAESAVAREVGREPDALILQLPDPAPDDARYAVVPDSPMPPDEGHA